MRSRSAGWDLAGDDPKEEAPKRFTKVCTRFANKRVLRN